MGICGFAQIEGLRHLVSDQTHKAETVRPC